MAFHKTKNKAEDVKDGGNSKFINKSGIYPVTLIAPFVDENDQQSVVVNLAVNHDGQDQAIYGNMSLSNNGGGDNEIGLELFNKLCVVVGFDGDVSEPVAGELPVGKKGADKELAVLADLADHEIMIRVQQEYSLFQGKIQEKQVLKGFYTAEGATAAELVNESEVGVQLEKDRAYENNITYKDGLDAEQIATWISGGRKDGTGGAAAKDPSFKKKKFGK